MNVLHRLFDSTARCQIFALISPIDGSNKLAGPTFLGIGAQRTGTTLLRTILKSHPEIQLPKKAADRFSKEVHFFDSSALTQDLRWYLQNFAPDDGEDERPVRGEITPAYSILPYHVVRHIKRLLPDLRLVFVIRSPIDRIWSNVLMRLTRFGAKSIGSSAFRVGAECSWKAEEVGLAG